MEAIQNYQRVEQEGRVKVRQRAERQVRIGKAHTRMQGLVFNVFQSTLVLLLRR